MWKNFRNRGEVAFPPSDISRTEYTSGMDGAAHPQVLEGHLGKIGNRLMYPDLWKIVLTGLDF